MSNISLQICRFYLSSILVAVWAIGLLALLVVLSSVFTYLSNSPLPNRYPTTHIPIAHNT
jgi:hypothetical protein